MRVPTSVVRPLRRLRADGWSGVQCGIAASVAWAVATDVLGHPRPFFAPIAALVALGVGSGGRIRRTAEIAVGVAMGVAVGDLLVSVIGQGAWQIGVVVTAALVLAIAVGGEGLLTTQAGLQAVLIVTLPRAPGSGFQRWQDALVGGAAALLVAAALPGDPWRHARHLGEQYVEELARMLRSTAAGVRKGSAPLVAAALVRGRAMERDLARWESALTAGHETARISLRHRGKGTDWDSAYRLTTGLTRSSRNLRVLVRRVRASLRSGVALPPALPDLLDEMAAAVVRLPEGESALGPLVELAGRLDPVVLGARNLAGQVVVGQLRVAVLDLLEAAGYEQSDARRLLPELPP